jgi:hypothetical protein
MLLTLGVHGLQRNFPVGLIPSGWHTCYYKETLGTVLAGGLI